MPPAPARTPGHKAILVADSAYAQLKALQSWRSSQLHGVPIRFDLKDIATAFVQEAMTDPDFPERVLQRALRNVTLQLTQLQSHPSETSK
jgi:hypothetical protein